MSQHARRSNGPAVQTANKSSLRVRSQHARRSNGPNLFQQSLQHQTEYPYRYLSEYDGMFRVDFYHCWNKLGLVISFGVCIPVKVASVYRAITYLLNLNQLQDLKFDIVYDNGVSLQTIVVYMKFPKEVPVVGWGKWAILPQFCTTSSFTCMHFLKFCMYGIYNNKQRNEMQNMKFSNRFFNLRVLPFTVPQICSNFSNWAKMHDQFSGSSKPPE